jgi:protein involved in sex pheromone biosynthesis
MKALKIHGLALSAIFILAVCASAQNNSAKTITNTDLEKYRQQRVKADDEYRRTYAAKGLPSPEELEKREEERQKRLFEFSDQLASERRQREYLELLAAAAANGANNESQVIYLAQDNDGGFYPVSVGSFGKTRFRNVSNVEMVRDQAALFGAGSLLNRNLRNSRRGGFRGRFNTRMPGRVFSPRR